MADWLIGEARLKSIENRPESDQCQLQRGKNRRAVVQIDRRKATTGYTV